MSNNEKFNWKELDPYLEKELSPLLSAKTVQIVLIRQVLDFSILRTEDSRELNVVELPVSLESTKSNDYGLFLASKQKAVESRKYKELLRLYNDDNECYLPMNLCMKCPRCVLFGAVKPKGGDYNIKHRVEYSSAYSIEPFEDINEIITFNAISETTQKTNQALNVTHNFKPLTIFPSIVTGKSITKEELCLLIKAILSSSSYGAETRVKGDTRNEIIGIVGGYEEIITPLELKLELGPLLNGGDIITKDDLMDKVYNILEKYSHLAGNSNNIKIFEQNKLNLLLKDIRAMDPIEALIPKLYEQAEKFLEKAND
jgi:CRISPR type I-D-associated protein Csc2